jgi:integrase/recombinase XerD
MGSVAAYLEDMVLRGCAETTVKARRCALARAETWLAEYRGNTSQGPAGGPGLARTPWKLAAPGSPARGHAGTLPVGDSLEALQPRPGSGPNQPSSEEWLPGPGLLETATPADLAAWRRSLTVAPASIAPYVAHLNAYYVWLQRTGIRADNPAEGLPVPRTSKGIPRPISESDLWCALESASARIRPWLVLAGWAAFRAREIAYLRREHVCDTAARPWLLVSRDSGKGRHERAVPMSGFVLGELRAAGLPSRGWVFPRHDGGAGPNTPGLVSSLANETLRRSGSDATLHQLRHRCLTMLHEETRDIRIVQSVAGHASLATTEVYTKVNQVRAADAMDALPVPHGRLRLVKEA